MKTNKIRIVVVLWALLVPLLAANSSDKKTVNKAESTEATENMESVINVPSSPFKKFVIVTIADTGLYKKADKNSPTMVRWDEADCESDFCEMVYQWSNQPDKPGFEMSTDLITYEGKVFPVLGEEGQFYKVYTFSKWCEIESAYIPKDCVGEIESAPINAEMLEAEDVPNIYRVIKDGKYKDIVLVDEYDELNGETFQVGVLKNGVVGTLVNCYIDSYLDISQKEDLVISETEDDFFIRYNKSLALISDGEPRQLDPRKLSAKHIEKIINLVAKKRSEYVNYMYHFPAMGLEYFNYKVK